MEPQQEVHPLAALPFAGLWLGGAYAMRWAASRLLRNVRPHWQSKPRQNFYSEAMPVLFDKFMTWVMIPAGWAILFLTALLALRSFV